MGRPLSANAPESTAGGQLEAIALPKLRHENRLKAMSKLISWTTFRKSLPAGRYNAFSVLIRKGFSRYCDTLDQGCYICRGDTPLSVAKKVEQELRHDKSVDPDDDRVIWHLCQNRDGEYIELYYKFKLKPTPQCEGLAPTPHTGQ